MKEHIFIPKNKFLESRTRHDKLIKKDTDLVEIYNQVKAEHDARIAESEKIVKSGGMVQKQQTCQGLEPYFSLSPMSPNYYYAPGNNQPTIDARLSCYGGYLGYYSIYHLSDYSANDRFVIGRDAVSLSDEADITDVKAQIRQKSTVHVLFYGYYYPVGKQMLLIFGFGRNQNEPINIQFFINGDFVMSQPIYGTSDQVAIIVELPEGSIWADVYARVAANSSSYTASFLGMHAYLI